MARGKGFRTKGASFPLQVAAILLFFVLPLRGTQSNYRLCFTQVVGLPITNPNQPPTIDGVISGDPGWTQAWRYVFGNGTNGPGCTSGTPCSPNVAVQGIKDNTFLYLSFEVNHDHTYDDNDLIVITLSPTGNPGDDRRIHIYPNRTCVSPYIGCSPPKGPGSAPRLVEYWTNSSTWNTTTNSACLANPCDPNVTDCVPPNATLPAGFDVKVSNSGANNSQNVSWFVEVKLPIAAFQIPTTSGSTFGLYFDVIRIDGNTGGYSEYYWPPNKANGQTNGIGCAVETNTPSPSDWGNGTVNPNATTPCYGVNLDWTDITSNHSQDQIDVTSGNAFTAQLKNNSVDGTGAPVPANQITAVFSIANFGLPSNWTPVPVSPNPGVIPNGFAGPVDILASGTASLATSPVWNITDPTLISNYHLHPDQCILVNLDSLAFGVTFVNKSVKRNMWVVNASQVSKTAEISAKGYAPHPAHKMEQEFILHVFSRSEILRPNEQPLSRTATGQTGQGPAVTKSRRKGGQIVSRLTWVVNGCRLTGESLVIKGKKYEKCDDVGAFGAVVEHFAASAVTRWRTTLGGNPGLTPIKGTKDTYRLRVQQDSTTTVTVEFAPEENKLALFLDVGAGVPHGTFGNFFNTGFSLNAGLEYVATIHFSAEGIFGYHHFPAKIGSALDLYQFSANGKFYLTSSGPLRPFVNGGIDGYKFSPGSTYFGGNFGAGILYELTPHWGLQGSYNFHTVNTPGAATKFSTIQGGIRFVF